MIEWEDSVRGDYWDHDKPKAKPTIIRTVGWVLNRSKKAIVLAGSISKEKDVQHASRMTISCCCVKTISALRKK